MFNRKFSVKIKDYLPNEYAHNPDLGEKIGEYIIKNNKNLKAVELNFEGVKTVNTAFCNALLYKLQNDNYLKENDINISITKYNDIIYETFMKVINNVRLKENDTK